MSRPEAKGWCPGAYRPMMSGDGLVVRVRPTLARLTRDLAPAAILSPAASGSPLADPVQSDAGDPVGGRASRFHDACRWR